MASNDIISEENALKIQNKIDEISTSDKDVVYFTEVVIKNEKRNDFSFVQSNQKISIKDAIFSKSKEIPVEEALGKICATPTVSCPPAIPIVVSGEEITKEHVELLKKYGKENIRVVTDH